MTSRLRLALAAATILGTAALPLRAEAAAPAPAFDPAAAGTPASAGASNAAPAIAARPDLRRFALAEKELTFSGENQRLDMPVFVTAAESAVPAKLVLDFESAISVLPEASRMVVLVNDAVVGEAPLGRAGRQSIAVDLPGGLLQPGFNGVRILVAQQHRVDCSLAGTWELWTKIDSKTSGFVFAGAPRQPAGLSELPAIAPGENGRIHLRGRVGSGATGAVVDATMTALQSAVLLGYYDAPVIDVSDKPGTGPGLDVVVGTVNEVAAIAPDARGNTAIPFVTLQPSEDGVRQTLVVSGLTPENVRQNLAELAAMARAAAVVGPVAGQRGMSMFQGRSIESGETVSFADLGADTRAFTGRFYHDDFRFVLPADFYAADYDYASITLDASFAAGLASSAQLVIRANDAVVTTLSLGSSKPGRIEKQRMRVPLQTLKPGVNVISMEALLPNGSDTACEASAKLSPDVRFSLSDTSSFTMPRFARVGHAPDIAATMAGIVEANRAEEKGMTVLVPNYDRPLLGAAATFVSKIASATRKVQPVRTISLMPREPEDDLLAFGTTTSLPTQLFNVVGIAQSGEAARVASASASGPLTLAAVAAPAPAVSAADEAAVLGGASPAPAAEEPGTEAVALGSSLRRSLDEFGMSAGWVLDQARDFATARTAPTVFVPSSEAALTIAQMPAPNSTSSTWTMLTAPSVDRIVDGVMHATDREHWSRLRGAVSEIFTGSETRVASHEATGERLYETQPRSVANGRLVLAGWFSRHTEQYLMALVGTLLMLALATALFLRGIGEKSS